MLLKIQAIDDMIIPAVPEKVVDGETIPGTPSVTIPGGSTVYQKTGTKSTNLTSTNLLIKNGSDNRVYINGENNQIKGNTRFAGDVYLDADVYISGNLFEIPRFEGTRLLSGKWFSRNALSLLPTSPARKSLDLLAADYTGNYRGEVTIINNDIGTASASTPLTITLSGGLGGARIYRKDGDSITTFITLAAGKAIKLTPGPGGDWFEI